MTVTRRSQELNTKVEPRPAGVMTESGLLKLSDGTLMARHGTDSGAREGDDIDTKLSQVDAQMAELDAMRQQEDKPKKQTRKKATKAEPTSDTVDATVTVEGFGGIPSQYDQVQIGNGCAILGLTSRSFIPQQAMMGADGKPTHVLRLSAAPDRRYIYTGNQVRDKRGVTLLILIEIPEGA